MLTAPDFSPDEAQQKHRADILSFHLFKTIGQVLNLPHLRKLLFMQHGAAQDPLRKASRTKTDRSSHACQSSHLRN